MANLFHYFNFFFLFSFSLFSGQYRWIFYYYYFATLESNYYYAAEAAGALKALNWLELEAGSWVDSEVNNWKVERERNGLSFCWPAF